MNPKFEALLKKKLSEKGKMHPVERDAKMSVLGDLHKMASDAMADRLKGVKKVSVMAPDDESLAEGLDTAKHLVASKDHEEDGDMEAHEGAIVPDVEDLEEQTGEDLDHDNEEGESDEHKQAMAEMMHPNMEHESEQSHPGEDESEDELDARIAELMEKKRKLEAMKKA